jgi:DNA-binding CsgD family transcriptional regulator
MKAINNTLQSDIVLKNVPGYIFWKGKDLAYSGGNDNFLRAIGISSVDDLYGKLDYDLPWGQSEAEQLRDSDLKVLEGTTIVNVAEARWHVDGYRVVIANKMPLRDADERIVGILGVHYDAHVLAKNCYQHDYQTDDINEASLYSTLNKISGNLLTNKEIQCLALWLSGYSIKETAYCLNISQKSIEAYRTHIKDKMKVYHKFQLMDLMESKGALSLFLAVAKIIREKSKKPI